MKYAFKRLAFLLGVCLLMPAPAQAAAGVPQEAIDARESVFRIFCEDKEWEYSGSGFAISADEDGVYIATNYHVVEDAFEDTIVVVLHGGEELPVEIVGYEQDADLCILKTADAIEDVIPLRLAEDKEIEVGRAVYTLGFPGAGDYLLDDYAYAVEDITITDGIISAVKHITVGGSEITMLQMNATINSGSSGGPLVNSWGEVLGVNSLEITEANDVYAAISVSHLKDLVEEYDIPLPVEEEKPQETAMVNAAQTSEPGGSILIPVLIGVVVAALLAIGVFWLVKFGKKPLSLDTLMQRRLQPYSMEEAKQKLMPIINSLASLHIRGEAHGGIYPANIFVDQFGNLVLGKAHKHSGVNMQTAPYLSMEHYAADGTIGTYSDVYALGAVLYYLITRKEPDTVIARLQNDTLGASLDVSSITEGERAALLTALALKKEERLHDVRAFANAVRMHNCPVMPVQNEPVISAPMGFAKAYDPCQSHKRIKVSRPAVLITCGVLLLGTLGTIWMVNGIRYRQAIRYLDQENYAAASNSIAGTLLVYQDTKELYYYINSAYFLELGYYDEAKERFVSQGDYRNAKEMAQECDYQKALATLETGDYAAAKKAFDGLGDYSDAKNMALECEYQRASSLLEKKEYDQARRVFEKLADIKYRDADEMVKEAKYRKAEDVFQKFIGENRGSRSRAFIPIDIALELLHSLKGYSKADNLARQMEDAIFDEGVASFEKIYEFVNFNDINSELLGRDGVFAEFSKNTQNYFSLVLSKTDGQKYYDVCAILNNVEWDWNDKCARFKKMWGFEPAQRLLQSNGLIYNFLTGSWKGDGRYFKVSRDEDGFLFTDDFYIVYQSGYKVSIEDLVYSVGNDKRGWKKVAMFSFTDSNTMEVYLFEDGQIFTLKRQ